MKYERAKRSAGARKGIDAICIVYPAVMAAILVLSFSVPAVSGVFGIEGFSHPLYLLISPIAPILVAALYFLLGKNERFAAFVRRFAGEKGNKRKEE